MFRAALNFLFQLPLRWPRTIVVGVLSLTVFFAFQIVDPGSGEFRLRIDSSVEGLLPSDTPERERFDDLEQSLGQGEPLVVALGMGDVFAEPNLRILSDVTSSLLEMQGISQVVSLATVDVVHSEDGEIEVRPFVSWIRADANERARLRKHVLENRIYAGNLVSNDGGTAAILVYLDEEGEGAAGPDVHARILDVSRENAAGVEVFLAGPSYVRAATAQLLVQNFTFILPLSVLAVVLVALFAFRSVAGVVVSVSQVAIGVVWILGGLALLGRPLNLVTIIVPPLLLSVGFAYAAHIVSDYVSKFREQAVAMAPGQALALAHREVALPVALTGLTTVAGFLSLVVSPFPAVREFGLISVVGIVVAVLLTLFYAPALLLLFRAPRPTGGRDRLSAFAVRFADVALRNRNLVVGLGAVVFVISLLGVSQIRVNSRMIDNLPPEHPVREDFYAVAERLGAGSGFHVLIEADRADAFVDPGILSHVDVFEQWLETQPEIGSSISLLDHLKLIHRVFRDDDPAFETIPDRPALSKQLLVIGGSRDLVDYVDSNYSRLNLHVRTRAIDSQSLRDLLRRIDDRLAELPESLRARITGGTVLLAGAVDDVAGGQVKSLSLAFVFIFVILAALFMSVRIGAAALIPNALPVAVYFGLIGFGGLPLDTTTGLLACIVLGIAVDDTIHFLTRFNKEARDRADEVEGARRAIFGIGRPVTITTLALCAGLLVLTASDLQNQVRFGALGAATLALAWLVDLTFTPALCSRFKVVGLWDVLTFDLGASPQETIPLFKGISTFQARIVALATRVVEIEEGSFMCRKGDVGDELWVVIDGEIEISIESGGSRTVLERFARGAVVGELALFHEGRRTADVRAATRVRAICLSNENLERFRSRYPRLGSRVLWNLSRVLATRLVRSTERYSETVTSR